MSVAAKASRTHVWLENLGEWIWPSEGGTAVEALPPPWVPAFPPRREPVAAASAPQEAPAISAAPPRFGLHAFMYGAESDHIANPDEDAPFAAALRAAGADATSAVYPGEHNLETIEAHLGSMLAGRPVGCAASLRQR